MRFSRTTIIAAANLLAARMTHSQFDNLMLELALDELMPRKFATSLQDKANALARINIYPDKYTFGESSNGIDDVRENMIRAAVRQLPITISADQFPWLQEKSSPASSDPDLTPGGRLIASLARDGFAVEHHTLRRALPEQADLPNADDEVHALLRKHDLSVPLGHLEQAIDAHGRTNWAAANSQLRSFLESLFE